MTQHSSESRPTKSGTGASIFYTVLQRRLHWLVLVLIIGQYLLQSPMREALAAIEQHQSLGVWQFLVTTAHTWSGISIAVIMLWRWHLRRQRPVPLNGASMPRRLATLVQIHHVALYVGVWSMALSGALHYYAGWSWAAQWHVIGKWVLLILIAVHVVGALVHLKQGHTVLQRMMGISSLR